jgi:flagellar biosynthetic protein FlhB
MLDNQENDTGEKTEAPSGRRVGQARTDGMVAKSQDLTQVITMVTAYLLLQNLCPRIWMKMQILFKTMFGNDYGRDTLTADGLRYHFYSTVLFLGPEILILMTVTAFVGAMTTALQTNFLWTSKLLKPKFKIVFDIIGALKRIVSIKNFVSILKSIIKLAIIAPIAYFGFMESLPLTISMMDLPIYSYLPLMSQAVSLIFWRVMKLLFVLGILDYAWQKFQTYRQLKMTKYEIKEEAKSTEGDEATKKRIRAKGIARIRERIFKNVRTADVIVTNPTHIAVALKYTMKKGSAPMVVAKGKGYVAERIKKIAREHGIPIIERKPIARALFAQVEIGQQIPYELYAAVAEILAYVFRLKGKNPFGARAQSQQQQSQQHIQQQKKTR